MKWPDLLQLIGSEPVFSSALLRAGNISDAQVRLQLARWTTAGRIIQLRRGVYMLAPPYRKIEPHPFLIANHLRKNAYVSLQSALAYHSLIPEYVPVVTSVTAARPEQVKTPIGVFIFKHMKMELLFGYQEVEVSRNQHAFVATPEKALLDLIYLNSGAEQATYLRELRLQNCESINSSTLIEYAERFGKPKLQRAVKNIIHILDQEVYEEL